MQETLVILTDKKRAKVTLFLCFTDFVRSPCILARAYLMWLAKRQINILLMHCQEELRLQANEFNSLLNDIISL